MIDERDRYRLSTQMGRIPKVETSLNTNSQSKISKPMKKERHHEHTLVAGRKVSSD